MFRKHTLQPYNGRGPSIEFEWDTATGEVRGRDAELVRYYAQDAAKTGSILIHPYPTVFEFTDNPLTSETVMAALLGESYRLDDALLAAYPQVPVVDTSEGTVN